MNFEIIFVCFNLTWIHRLKFTFPEFTHILDAICQNTICVYKFSYTTVSSCALWGSPTQTRSHSSIHLLFIVCFRIRKLFLCILTVCYCLLMSKAIKWYVGKNPHSTMWNTERETSAPCQRCQVFAWFMIPKYMHICFVLCSSTMYNLQHGLSVANTVVHSFHFIHFEQFLSICLTILFPFVILFLPNSLHLFACLFSNLKSFTAMHFSPLSAIFLPFLLFNSIKYAWGNHPEHTKVKATECVTKRTNHQ